MICKASAINKRLYGYHGLIRQSQVEADFRALFRLVLKKHSQLIVLGGVCGNPLTGVPESFHPATSGVYGLTPMAMIQSDLCRELGLVFINLGVYTTLRHNLDLGKQQVIRQTIKEYLQMDAYIFLCWTYSQRWLDNVGL